MHKSAFMIDHHELCARTFKFACDVASLCIRLQERGPVVKRLSMKLLDAGPSIGANIEESRAGQTKPDFIASFSFFVSPTLRDSQTLPTPRLFRLLDSFDSWTLPVEASYDSLIP